MVKLNRLIFTAEVLMLSIILVGCNQSFDSVQTTVPPRPLPSVQTEPVFASQLPPANSKQQFPEYQQGETAPMQPEKQSPSSSDTMMADARPTSSYTEITREGMAGSWYVPTDNVDCRIILAFTKWSGGYRAATRRCDSLVIQSVTAWDVKEQSVVLVDQSGNEIARLFGITSGRYDGRTKDGDPISFAR